MKFCKKCNNMLYIHSTENVVEIKYTCRNCEYKEVDKNPIRCVYENIYNQTNSTHDIIYNKYTRHDATLPRVNTIKCINQNCISNKNLEDVLILTDLSIHQNREDFDSNLSIILSQFGNPEILNLDEDTLIIKANRDNVLELRDNLSRIHSFIEYHNTVDSQIIFIKYDPDGLKYVYICDYCNTSWKK